MDVHIASGQTCESLASLTISAGTLTTSGSNYTLTVAGKTYIGDNSGSDNVAVLTCNDSDIILGSGYTSDFALVVIGGGTFTGGGGTHTIGSIYGGGAANARITLTDGTTNINSRYDDSTYTHAIYLTGDAAAFAHGGGTVLMNYSGASELEENGGTLALNNLTINHASADVTLGSILTVAGALTITAGELDTSGSNHALTVTGACDIGTAGNLDLNGSTVSLGTLAVANSGSTSIIFSSATTTIALTPNSTHPTWTFGIGTSATANFNSGTIKFLKTVTGGYLQMGSTHVLNDVIVDSNYDIPWAGHFKAASLDIQDGNLNSYGGSSGMTITGALTVGNGTDTAASNYTDDSNGFHDQSFGSVTINANGTFKASNQTTTINGGFHNNGTYTHNGGTVEMGGTGSVVNALPPKLKINNDAVTTFDGTDDYITVADHSDLDFTNAMTVMAWVKTDGSEGGNYSRIIEKDGSFQMYIYSTGNNLGGWITSSGSGQGDVDSGLVVDDGSWHHCAMSWDGAVQRFYVDGVEGTSNDATDGNLSNSANAFTASAASTQAFDGEIADVRAYSAALTQAQIQQLASHINKDDDLGSSNSNLKLWWKCDEGTGTSIADSSGNSHTGTLTNGTWLNNAFTTTLLPTMTEVDSLEVSSGVLDLDNRNCLHFDGTNDYAIATSTKGDIEWSGQAFTMAGWVYMTDSSKNILMSLVPSTSSNDGAVLVIDEDDSSHNNSIALSFKEYGTSDNDNTAGATAAATLAANTWHHIAVTYNGSGSGTIGNYNFYIDGALFETGKALTSGDFSGRTDTLTANKVYIGRDKTEFFKGKMRDVRLHFNDLSAEQIHSIYLGRYNVTPDHWWKMDEGTGTNINDYGTATESDATATDFAMSGGASSDWETANFKINGSARIGTNGSI
jgi:hypothetical protein